MGSQNSLKCMKCKQEFEKGKQGSIIKSGIFLLASNQCFCSENCRSLYFIKEANDRINDSY